MAAEKTYKVLTPTDVEHFMTHGYVKIPGCFTKEASDEWTKDVWLRLGMSPTDKSTWTRERINMPEHRRLAIPEFSPKAWDAICDLVGGEERVTDKSKTWSDSFIVNLGTEENEGKEFKPKELDNWHVDGDFFTHFLDSPEQALLVIPLYTDIIPNGGGTWVCTEGPAKIGKWLYDHPQGVTPQMIPVPLPKPESEDHLAKFYATIQTCDDSSFHEMTGEVGDVILLHPLMLHSASKNGRRHIRIITNPPVSLKQPFEFDRADPSQYSLVELKTIQDLGGFDKFKGWKITGERKPVIPERLKMQLKMMEDEARRLRESGVEYADRTQTEDQFRAKMAGTAVV
ncbi:hypothetical protein B0A52_06332 [Exophiala mesophila]|uniref:Uncharacterized protein n=1 Tax=Exophiala mesophila TaxID=212818 RepID=A0A438N1S7_EXOME|nr:hypothetical protein B0A52_06332 [Exophiala mesophila]